LLFICYESHVRFRFRYSDFAPEAQFINHRSQIAGGVHVKAYIFGVPATWQVAEVPA
jgi:hypothetical protein